MKRNRDFEKEKEILKRQQKHTENTEENNFSNCEWLNYNKNYTYTLSNTKNGSKVIYGFFKDKAGNISSKSLTYKCKTCSSTFTANYTFASPAGKM